MDVKLCVRSKFTLQLGDTRILDLSGVFTADDHAIIYYRKVLYVCKLVPLLDYLMENEIGIESTRLNLSEDAFNKQESDLTKCQLSLQNSTGTNISACVSLSNEIRIGRIIDEATSAVPLQHLIRMLIRFNMLALTLDALKSSLALEKPIQVAKASVRKKWLDRQAADRELRAVLGRPPIAD